MRRFSRWNCLAALVLMTLVAAGCARRAPTYVYAQPQPAVGGPYVAAPVAARPAPAAVIAAPVDPYLPAQPAGLPTEPYLLDSGDRLRVQVFGQDGLSNSYIVDAAGNVTLSLVGPVAARGLTTAQLTRAITARLQNGYVREPHVSVEVEAYRPFFILGEVNAPGQYPYVANMTAESAVAIAGGYAPRADKKKITITRNIAGQMLRQQVPLNYPVRPGDTITISERWL
jgi:polysaccharide export outer membrane protein